MTEPLFDPEMVNLHVFGCCSWEDVWECGGTMPTGWGNDAKEFRENAYVSTQDYDKLLEMYRELRALLTCFANDPDIIQVYETAKAELAALPDTPANQVES